jgi:hypothetical protein
MRVSPRALENPNSDQETGSSTALPSLTMASMSEYFRRVQVRPLGFSRNTVSCLLLLITLLWTGSAAQPQAPAGVPLQTTEPHTTLVIFADRRIEESEWSALIGAMRRNLVEAAEGTEGLAGTPEIVRGDTMASDLRVETVIVVYLHGDCNLAPLVARTAFGVPLGWVRREDGRIEPFVHVDCTRIGQVLGPQALGLNRDQRNAVMTGAIARVILHEWIHIATQNPAHAERGIAKAQFGVADLMAGNGVPFARLRNQ